ncbi:MAG: DUF2029 domain-containing protein [Tepidisphaera sp.]
MMNARDRFRANVLPWVLGLVVAAVASYFAFRAFRGLPTEANPGKGDFEHFYHAARAMMLGQDIYASHTRGYIYPPLLAMLLRPLAGFDLRPAQLAWAGVNLLMVAGTVMLSLQIAVKRLGIPREKLTFIGIAAVALILGFEPIRQEIEEGQTDTIVALCLVGALAALDRKPLLAGVLIGLGANIKYQALVVVPYLLIRRRWAAAASTAVSTAAFALIPAIVVGWKTNLQYLGIAFGGIAKLLGVAPEGPIVKTHDIRWEKSISITSGIAKTLGPETADRVVLGLAVCIAGLTLAAAWWIYRRRGLALFQARGGERETESLTARVVTLEWSGLLVAVLAFGPQTLIRHMYILLPMFVWTAAVLLVPRRGVFRGVLAAGVLALIAGMLLPPGNVKSFEPALNTWRSIGGTGWCLVAMYLCLLWTGLEYARAAEERRELLDPPPGWDPAGPKNAEVAR